MSNFQHAIEILNKEKIKADENVKRWEKEVASAQENLTKAQIRRADIGNARARLRASAWDGTDAVKAEAPGPEQPRMERKPYARHSTPVNEESSAPEPQKDAEGREKKVCPDCGAEHPQAIAAEFEGVEITTRGILVGIDPRIFA